MYKNTYKYSNRFKFSYYFEKKYEKTPKFRFKFSKTLSLNWSEISSKSISDHSWVLFFAVEPKSSTLLKVNLC